MNRTDTLLRLKRFRVDEMKRRMASIEAMKADLEKKLSDLDDNVAREKQRAGDSDIGRLAFPSERGLPGEPNSRSKIIEVVGIYGLVWIRAVRPHKLHGSNQIGITVRRGNSGHSAGLAHTALQRTVGPITVEINIARSH